MNIEQNLQGKIDEIKMNPVRKAEIRQNLELFYEEKYEKNSKFENDWNNGRRQKKVLISVLAVTSIFMLLLISPSRNLVQAAIEQLRQTFNLLAGGEVIYEQNEEGNQLTFQIRTENKNDYVQVEDGRLYFAVDNMKEDITEKCSETTYYRYEKVNQNQTKNVILVGGTVQSYEIIELCFNANGVFSFGSKKFSTEEMTDQPWFKDAMNSEGVTDEMLSESY